MLFLLLLLPPLRNGLGRKQKLALAIATDMLKDSVSPSVGPFVRKRARTSLTKARTK